MRNSVPKSKRTRLRINVGMHSPQLSDMESRWCSVALAPCRVNWQKYALIRADEMSLSLASRRDEASYMRSGDAREPSQYQTMALAHVKRVRKAQNSPSLV
jgi:hypothetical protein